MYTVLAIVYYNVGYFNIDFERVISVYDCSLLRDTFCDFVVFYK